VGVPASAHLHNRSLTGALACGSESALGRTHTLPPYLAQPVWASLPFGLCLGKSLLQPVLMGVIQRAVRAAATRRREA
jgi:hypothetical protein